jgi:hypothetical protein
MFCRGDSNKETLDTNHELLIFLHHGDDLYEANYVLIDKNKDEEEGNQRMELKFVSKIHSSRLHLLTSDKFMFLENITNVQRNFENDY